MKSCRISFRVRKLDSRCRTVLCVLLPVKFDRKAHFINFVSSDTLVRNLPEWLPGMEFKRKGREWAKTVASLSDRPYTFVQHQMVQFEQMAWITY